MQPITNFNPTSLGTASSSSQAHPSKKVRWNVDEFILPTQLPTGRDYPSFTDFALLREPSLTSCFLPSFVTQTLSFKTKQNAFLGLSQLSETEKETRDSLMILFEETPSTLVDFIYSSLKAPGKLYLAGFDVGFDVASQIAYRFQRAFPQLSSKIAVFDARNPPTLFSWDDHVLFFSVPSQNTKAYEEKWTKDSIDPKKPFFHSFKLPRIIPPPISGAFNWQYITLSSLFISAELLQAADLVLKGPSKDHSSNYRLFFYFAFEDMLKSFYAILEPLSSLCSSIQKTLLQPNSCYRTLSKENNSVGRLTLATSPHFMYELQSISKQTGRLIHGLPIELFLLEPGFTSNAPYRSLSVHPQNTCVFFSLIDSSEPHSAWQLPSSNAAWSSWHVVLSYEELPEKLKESIRASCPQTIFIEKLPRDKLNTIPNLALRYVTNYLLAGSMALTNDIFGNLILNTPVRSVADIHQTISLLKELLKRFLKTQDHRLKTEQLYYLIAHILEKKADLDKQKIYTPSAIKIAFVMIHEQMVFAEAVSFLKANGEDLSVFPVNH